MVYLIIALVAGILGYLIGGLRENQRWVKGWEEDSDV
jgi:hypothetical protein